MPGSSSACARHVRSLQPSDSDSDTPQYGLHVGDGTVSVRGAADAAMCELATPWGWFAVGFSHELPRRDVLTRRLAGEELVVWRGADGSLGATSSTCPHLGAHLGRGSVDRRCDPLPVPRVHLRRRRSVHRDRRRIRTARRSDRAVVAGPRAQRRAAGVAPPERLAAELRGARARCRADDPVEPHHDRLLGVRRPPGGDVGELGRPVAPRRGPPLHRRRDGPPVQCRRDGGLGLVLDDASRRHPR